jgi:hypothetical protein
MLGRDAHFDAVEVARAKVTDVQNAAHTVRLRCLDALAAASQATGDEPGHPVARVALESVIVLSLKTDELIAMCVESRERLAEYGRIF